MSQLEKIDEYKSKQFLTSQWQDCQTRAWGSYPHPRNSFQDFCSTCIRGHLFMM